MTRRRPVAALIVLLACIYAASCGDSPYEPGFTTAPDAIARSNHDPLAGGSSGITVPTTGSSDDGGKFRGTIAITGADFDSQLGPVLLVRIRGSLIPASTGDDGDPTEDVNLNFGPVEMNYDQVDKDDDCIQLELSPGSVFDSETKRTIELEPAQIATHTLPGPANIIADLICANDEAIEMGWSPSEPPQ